MLDLDARFGTFIFRDIIGSPDSLFVIQSQFHPFWPLIVITSEVVQVQLILLEFCAISSGRWSSVLRVVQQKLAARQRQAPWQSIQQALLVLQVLQVSLVLLKV